MALGKLPVPGRPTIWMIVGQGPIALAVGAGGGCLDIFILLYPFSPLSPSLWETARYRLKYCLKGPLNPKPTNQPNLRSAKRLASEYTMYTCTISNCSFPGFIKSVRKRYVPDCAGHKSNYIMDGWIYMYVLYLCFNSTSVISRLQ